MSDNKVMGQVMQTPSLEVVPPNNENSQSQSPVSFDWLLRNTADPEPVQEVEEPIATSDPNSPDYAWDPDAPQVKGIRYDWKGRPDLTIDQFQRLMDTFDHESFGLEISSKQRDVDYNAAVDGDVNSKHISGMAIDYVGSEEAMQKAFAWGAAHGIFGEVHDVGSGRHYHAQGSHKLSDKEVKEASIRRNRLVAQAQSRGH